MKIHRNHHNPEDSDRVSRHRLVPISPTFYISLITEAGDSDAASQEIGSGPDRHRQLSASVESDLHVEGH